MALRFDKKGLANEILDKLKIELDNVFETWEREVYSKLKYPFLGEAVVETELRKETDKIVAYLKANIYVLADSYGTGSLMLDDNPGFQEYRNSDRWNSRRKGKVIVGKPKEDKKDAFGRPNKSQGRMAGLEIEGLEMLNGDVIEPLSPSYALQDAEKFLYSTYLPNAYKLAIRKVNFAKYLIES